MAVTNGWGKGVINNTNGFGKLATNNIGAGSIYENSHSGDTALIGTSASTYSSTRSFSFDGVNDYFDFGNNFNFGDGDNDFPFSLSIWFFRPSTGSARILIRDSEWELRITGGNVLKLQLNDNNGRFRGKSGNFTGTGWHHIAATYTGVGGTNAQDGIKIYVDGVRIDDTDINSGGNYKSMHNNGGNTNLARLPNGTGYTAGKFDELSIWDSSLSSDAITEIYNSGTPNDLESLTNASSSNLLAWYKMGEDSTFSTSWSMPNSVDSSNTATSFNMDITDLSSDTP